MILKYLNYPFLTHHKGPGKNRGNKYPNTCSCFKKRDCKTGKCSRCPNALRCGKPINKRCKNDLDCCTGKCVRNKCSNCDCLGSKCQRNTQCCSGNCVKRVCQSSDNCLPKMKRCTQENKKHTTSRPSTKANRRPRKTTVVPGKGTNQTQECCEGLECINKKCQEPTVNCTKDGDPCSKKIDCCNRFCDKQGRTREKGICRSKTEPCKNSGTCKNETECCSKTCVRGQCKSNEKNCIPKHLGQANEDDNEGERKCRDGGSKSQKCCAPNVCENGKCVAPTCKQENRECTANAQNEAEKCCSSLDCKKERTKYKCKSNLPCIKRNQACTPGSTHSCCGSCRCEQRRNKNRSFVEARGRNPDTKNNSQKEIDLSMSYEKDARMRKPPRTKKPSGTKKPPNTSRKPAPTQATKKTTTMKTTKDGSQTTKSTDKSMTTKRGQSTTPSGGKTTKRSQGTTQKPSGKFTCQSNIKFFYPA